VKKVGRILAAVATMGLAMTAAGCGSNVIGADGPQPGLAASVEDAEITLDDLSSAVEGLCTLQEADEAAPATSREYARAQILQFWITALVDAEYADDQQIEAAPEDPRLEQLPGWDDVSDDDREALEEYVDAVVYSSAVRQEVSEEEPPDPADYDITINPRFDVKLEGNEFVPAGEQLSVPVSDEAGTDIEEPTPEMLQELPDDELCGKRPPPAAVPPSLPVG